MVGLDVGDQQLCRVLSMQQYTYGILITNSLRGVYPTLRVLAKKCDFSQGLTRMRNAATTRNRRTDIEFVAVEGPLVRLLVNYCIIILRNAASSATVVSISRTEVCAESAWVYFLLRFHFFASVLSPFFQFVRYVLMFLWFFVASFSLLKAFAI